MTHSIEICATALFGFAILHTFSVKRFQHLASKFPEGSVGENLFHLLGEVEIVFGLWAALLSIFMIVSIGTTGTIHYIEGLNFTEPAFVFVIMAIASTKPILEVTQRLILGISKVLPLSKERAFFITTLVVGPLLGSFITEPAAMTVTALLLKDRYLERQLPESFKYFTLATLFVNISIGGVLTPYAAPPVLMVAGTWGWDIGHMLSAFGWKAAIAVCVNALLLTGVFWKSFAGISDSPSATRTVPLALSFIHLSFLALVVLTAHHPIIFLGIFLFFLGLTVITKEYQEELKLKESLLVGFFLGGLVVLGSLQGWWLQPLLMRLDAFPLFLGSAFLTAFLDNAALTYLGAQVPGITDVMKYALVAGAVAGGGLTVVANAPNPAGFSILKSSFGSEGISPARLFLFAIPPTVIALGCFWLFG